MKGEVARRQRVLRVRHVQHAMAATETARARDEAEGIARNVERRVSICDGQVLTIEQPPRHRSAIVAR